jgi:hypothetical protein
MKALKFFLYLILAVIFVGGNSEMFNYVVGGGWLNGSLASIGMFVVCVLGFNYLMYLAVIYIRSMKGTC